MILSDVQKLLAYCSAFDHRRPSEAEARAWADALPAQLTYDRAHEAVRIFYQQHTKPISIAELIQYAKTVEIHKRGAFYGEPGEILCSECRGVHYPHEDCSVLVPMPPWFRDEVKRLTGKDSADLFKVPPDVEDLEGF